MAPGLPEDTGIRSGAAEQGLTSQGSSHHSSEAQTQPSDVQAILLSPENKLLIPKLPIRNGPWIVLDSEQVVAWEDCTETMLRTEEIVAYQGSSLGMVEHLYTCNHGVCCQSETGLILSLTRGPSPPARMKIAHSQAQLWATPIHPVQDKSSQGGAHRGQMVLRQHQWCKYSPGFGRTCALILCIGLSQQLGHP